MISYEHQSTVPRVLNHYLEVGVGGGFQVLSIVVADLESIFPRTDPRIRVMLGVQSGHSLNGKMSSDFRLAAPCSLFSQILSEALSPPHHSTAKHQTSIVIPDRQSIANILTKQ